MSRKSRQQSFNQMQHKISVSKYWKHVTFGNIMVSLWKAADVAYQGGNPTVISSLETRMGEEVRGDYSFKKLGWEEGVIEWGLER